ncbi:MAG: hypothetical protein EKK41_21215 [Hyphomicrobiales bacterium]|nr:MAG: hypothetical protein EKK41_21215 [Hyphomicrobiales bacterium]
MAVKVVAIAAAKGGSGKTTIVLSLAVRAMQDGKHVALFDLNGDQGDLTKWWLMRRQPMNPRVLDVEDISRDVAALRASERCDWLFLDTPPLELDVIENAIMESDAVIIPCRPGFFDVDSVVPVVEIAKRRQKPYAFLLTAVDSKMPKVTDSAMSALVNDGPIMATRIRYLQPYIQSVVRGKSAAEIDKACQTEMDHLWAEVQRLAADAKPSFTAVRGS